MLSLRQNAAVLSLALTLVGGVSCESSKKLDSQAALLESVAISVVAHSGLNQRVTPRMPLPEPFVFKLSDREGRPLIGAAVKYCLIDVTGISPDNITPAGLFAACNANKTDLPETVKGDQDSVFGSANGTQSEDIVGQIVESTTRSNDKGEVQATLKAPARFDRQIAVYLTIVGNTSGGIGSAILFKTTSFGEAENFVLETANDKNLTAGVPFDLFVTVRDKSGYQVKNYEEKVDFTLKYDIPSSWAGQGPILPKSRFSCSFSGGRCLIPGGPFSIAAAGHIKIEMINHASADQILTSEFDIAVGPEARVILASALGGPTGSALPLTPIKLAQGAKKTIAAAVTDLGGNFLRDAPEAMWSLSNENIRASVPIAAAPSFVFSSAISGVGDLVAVVADLAQSDPLSVEVLPGPHAKWVVKTQHNSVERAGECFTVSIAATDAEGNINTAVAGLWELTLGFGGVTESGPLVGGKAQWISSDKSFGRSTITTVSMVSGQSLLPLKACLYDATDVSPAVTVSSPYLGDSSKIISGSQSIQVNLSDPAGVGLSTAPFGQTGDNPCGVAANTPEDPCVTLSVDEVGRRFYAMVVDKGGNPLRGTPSTWSVSGPLAAVLDGHTFTDYAPVTATQIGAGVVTLTSNDGFSTSKYYKVTHGVPASFGITSQHNGTEAATQNFAVKFKAYDQFGNFCDSFAGSRNFTVTLQNAAPSPAPVNASPVTTFTEQVSFAAGLATSTGKLLAPLATSQPGTTVVKPFIRATSQSANFDSPQITVAAGVPSTTQIRSAEAGVGAHLTAPVGVRADLPLPVFVASYDSQGNYVRGEVSTFSTTGVLTGTLSASSGSTTTIIPNSIGAGSLTATPLDTSIAPVTVNPINITSSSAESFRIVTTHNQTEMAGQPFNITIYARDHDGNTSAAYDGDKTLNFQITTLPSWSGQASVLPNGNVVCTFSAGTCVLSASGSPINYSVSDASTPHTLNVTDVGNEVPDVWAVNITAVKGAAAKMVMTDKLGGPVAGAIVMTAPITMTADDSKLFAAAKVDAGGNYVADIPNTATWTGTTATVTGKLSVTTGTSTTFNPVPVGTGRVKVSLAGLADGQSPLITIGPGALSKIVITTEHNNVEIAGEPFSSSIKLTDADGNTATYFNQLVSVNSQWINTESGPATYGPGEFWYPCVVNYTNTTCKVSSAVNIPIDFNAGVGSLGSYESTLYDASNVTPQLHVTINPGGGQPVLSVDSNGIAVQVGPPDHVTFMHGPTDDGNFLCDDTTSQYPASRSKQAYPWTNTSTDPTHWYLTVSTGQGIVADHSCLELSTDDGNMPVYAHLQDKGNNFISLASGNWTYESPATNNSSIVTAALSNATLAGLNADLTVTSGTSSTTLRNRQATTFGSTNSQSTTFAILKFVSTAPAGFYGLAPISVHAGTATDFVISGATLSAIKPMNIQVHLKDAYGNIGDPKGAPERHSVTIAWHGGTPPPTSNAGHAPLLPYAAACEFTSTGGAKYQGQQRSLLLNCPLDGAIVAPATYPFPGVNMLYVPMALASTTVDITVGSLGTKQYTFATAAGSGPGVVGYYRVLQAPAQNAATLAPGPTYTTDDHPIFYPSYLDVEENFVASVMSSYTETGVLTGNLSTSPATTFTLNPITTGTGTLAFAMTTGSSLAGSSGDLGTVTINPGALHHFVIATEHTGVEAAGAAFTLSVKGVDAQGNTCTQINGPVALYWTTSNSGANSEGRSAILDGVAFPTNGAYAFTNGIMTATVNATLFNSVVTPSIIVSTLPGGTGIIGNTGAISVSPGTPHHYGVTVSSGTTYYPTSDFANSMVGVVELRDQWGNRMTSGGETGVSLTMYNADGTLATGTLQGTITNLDLTSGQVAFNNLKWARPGSFQLKAAKPAGGIYTTPVGAGTVASDVITAVATLATVKRYAINFLSPFTAGSSAYLQINAVDDSDVTITTIDAALQALTYTFGGIGTAPLGTTPTIPTSIAFVSGQSFHSVTLYAAETIAAGSLTVHDSQATPKTGASTGALVVNAAAVNHYDISSSHTTRNADATGLFDLTIKSYDFWNNARAGEAGLTLSPVQVSGVPTVGPLHGPAVTGLNMSTVDTLTLTGLSYYVPHVAKFAISGGVTTITNSPNMTFTATAGTINHYTLTMPASPATGLNNTAVGITAKDEAENTITTLDATLNAYTFTWAGANTSASAQAPVYGVIGLGATGGGVFSAGVAAATHSLYAGQVFAIGGFTLTDNASTPHVGSNSAQFIVRGGPATKFVLTTPSAAVTAGVPFDVSVEARDAFDNVDTTFTSANLDFAWVNANSVPDASSAYTSGLGATSHATVKPTTAVQTFTNGVWTSTGGAFTLYNAFDSGVALSLTSPALPTANLALTVSAATTLSKVLVQAGSTASTTAYPSTYPSIDADTATFPVYAHGYDTYGNWKGLQTVNFHASGTWTGSGVPLNGAQSSGVTNTNISPFVAGTGNLVVKNLANTTTLATVAFTVTAGAPTNYSVSAPGNVTAGALFTVTVSAKDARGNSSTAYSGSKTLTFSYSQGGIATAAEPTAFTPTVYGTGSPTAVTFTSGSASLATGFRLYNAADVAKVRVSGDLVAASSQDINVNTATATQLFLVPSSYSPTAGSPFNATVKIKDAYSNDVTTATGSFNFTWAGASASSLAGGCALAKPGNGVVSISSAGTVTTSNTPFTLCRRTGTNYDTAASLTLTVACNSCTPSGLTSYTTAASAFTVNPAALDHIYVQATSSNYPLPASKLTGTIASLAANNTTKTFHAWGYDIYDNAISTQSVTWSTGAVTNATLSTTSGTSTVLTPGDYTGVGQNPPSIGSETITAANTTPASSVTLTQPITEGTASKFAVTYSGATTLDAGTTFGVTLTAQDFHSNTATAYNGSGKSIAWTWSGTNLTPAANSGQLPLILGSGRTSFTGSLTFTSGVYTSAGTDFAMYSSQATNPRVQASSSSPLSIAASQGPVLTINALTASSMALQTSMPTFTAGTAGSFNAFLTDTYGNYTNLGCTGAQLTLACTSAGNCDSQPVGTYGVGAGDGSKSPTFSGSPYSLTGTGQFSVTGATFYKSYSSTVSGVAGVNMTLTASCTSPVSQAFNFTTINADNTSTFNPVGVNTVYLSTASATLPASGGSLASTACTSANPVTCPQLYAYAFDKWGNDLANGGLNWSCPSWAYADGNSAPFNTTPYNSNPSGLSSSGHGSGASVSRAYHMNGTLQCKVSGTVKGATTLSLTPVTARPYTFSCGAWSCAAPGTPRATCTVTNSSGYNTSAYSFSGPSNGSITTNNCTAGATGAPSSSTCTIIVTGVTGQTSTGIGVTGTIDAAHSSFVSSLADPVAASISGAAPNCP